MSTDALFDDIVERDLFLELVASGTPPMLAGHECGWTPRRTARNMADPEFAELIAYALDRRIDGVEKALFAQAMKGNMAAVQMVLLNLRPEVFRDVKRIEIKSEHQVSGTIVHSTVQAAKQLMAELGPAALQIGGALDQAIEARSRELPDG